MKSKSAASFIEAQRKKRYRGRLWLEDTERAIEIAEKELRESALISFDNAISGLLTPLAQAVAKQTFIEFLDGLRK